MSVVTLSARYPCKQCRMREVTSSARYPCRQRRMREVSFRVRYPCKHQLHAAGELAEDGVLGEGLPYSRTVLRALWKSQGVGWFLMSEVPL